MSRRAGMRRAARAMRSRARGGGDERDVVVCADAEEQSGQRAHQSESNGDGAGRGNVARGESDDEQEDGSGWECGTHATRATKSRTTDAARAARSRTAEAAG